MWRHVILMLPLLLVGWLTGRAMEAHAAEPSEELIAVAAEDGVEPVKLEGAVNTTQLPPRTYLEMTGELKQSRPRATAAPVSGLWFRLAQCESSGNWAAVSRSGTYRGGLQFDQQTWAAYGGRAYASSAHLATPAQQIAVAERLRAARGLQPWPVCGRRV